MIACPIICSMAFRSDSVPSREWRMKRRRAVPAGIALEGESAVSTPRFERQPQANGLGAAVSVDLVEEEWHDFVRLQHSLAAAYCGVDNCCPKRCIANEGFIQPAYHANLLDVHPPASDCSAARLDDISEMRAWSEP